MFDITNIESWRKRFGLFPIQIKPKSPNKYALLNGGVRDFCVDLDPNDKEEVFNSYAWSANTKNYLTVKGGSVVIYNWLKSDPEKISKDTVQNNIEKFYDYLGRQTYRTENDVVPFVLRLFRKMRNLTQEKKSPQEALSLLFILLMSIDEDINQLDYKKWAIDEVKLPWGFETFIEELKEGVGPAKPDLGIILRHCSGPIFQEAHNVAQIFYPNRDLFGGISGKVDALPQAYSSTHYTPQYVARSIVEQCVKRVDLQKECVKIFDPACGSGEFLMEALKQLHNKQYAGKIVIRGWDNSECAVSASKFLLNYEKETIWHERLLLDIQVVSDSLEEEWYGDNDIILMNPPFVSWKLLDKEQKAVVSRCFQNKITKPNQAIAFVKRAIDSLSESGILGCVVPSSLFMGEAYKPLQDQMREELSSCLVGKLGNFIFNNVLTDVSIYVCQKQKNTLEPTMLWCKNEKGVAQDALCALRKFETGNWKEESTNRYSIYISDSYPHEDGSWKIISQQEDRIRKVLNSRLGQGTLIEAQNLFTIRQGVRTGANILFIINREEYERLSTEEKSFYRKSVDNEAISFSKLNPKHYVWYPYNESGLIITAEEQLKECAPATYERLVMHKDKLETRATVADKSNWWTLGRHRVSMLKKSPRLVSTEFGNSKSFSFDVQGDCVVERGYVWIPKKKFTTTDFYFYLSIFSSSLFDKLLSIYSKQLAGGNWYDLAAKYTKLIPIPNFLEHRDTELYSNLTYLGKNITEEGSDLYLRQINELVSILYSITDYDN